MEDGFEVLKPSSLCTAHTRVGSLSWGRDVQSHFLLFYHIITLITSSVNRREVFVRSWSLKWGFSTTQ